MQMQPSVIGGGGALTRGFSHASCLMMRRIRAMGRSWRVKSVSAVAFCGKHVHSQQMHWRGAVSFSLSPGAPRVRRQKSTAYAPVARPRTDRRPLTSGSCLLRLPPRPDSRHRSRQYPRRRLAALLGTRLGTRHTPAQSRAQPWPKTFSSRGLCSSRPPPPGYPHPPWPPCRSDPHCNCWTRPIRSNRCHLSWRREEANHPTVHTWKRGYVDTTFHTATLCTPRSSPRAAGAAGCRTRDWRAGSSGSSSARRPTPAGLWPARARP